MRHRNKTTVLDRMKGPRESMLKNLATSVILYEKVKTTRAKAKAVLPIVERAITAGKLNTLAARRHLSELFTVKNAVNKILEDIAPRYKEKNGGYLRILPLKRRVGDGAEVVQIELV